MANASFALGMVAPIADKLTAMKAGRDKANHRLTAARHPRTVDKAGLEGP